MQIVNFAYFPLQICIELLFIGSINGYYSKLMVLNAIQSTLTLGNYTVRKLPVEFKVH